MKAIKALLILSLAATALLATAAGLQRTTAPEGASVYFIAPQDGDTVSSPVTIRFGLEGMGVAPASIDFEDTGHHHLLINVDEEKMPALNRPLPTTDQIVHFNGGQTEAQIELEPGEHRLQLMLGDYRHIPHDPEIASEIITITVE